MVLEGLTVSSGSGGALHVGAQKLQAEALRAAAGPLTLEIARATLEGVQAQLRTENGKPHVSGLEAAGAELSGVKVQGPLLLPDKLEAAAGDWALEPLATADGTLRAEIVDAHLMFDADVTVPIRQGQIVFNDARVEHVGPDSRMGVSRMGIYVDAANGRSYLYQFPTAPVAGVQFEHRGAMLGPWVSDRGNLRLKEFVEGLLRQGQAGQGIGFTEQARLLLDRTSASGFVQLGDGRLAAAGMQANLAGRAQERNVVRVHSPAVGRGLTAEVAALAMRGAALKLKDMQASADEVAGSATARFYVENGQVRFELNIASLTLAGLRLA